MGDRFPGYRSAEKELKRLEEKVKYKEDRIWDSPRCKRAEEFNKRRQIREEICQVSLLVQEEYQEILPARGLVTSRGPLFETMSTNNSTPIPSTSANDPAQGGQQSNLSEAVERDPAALALLDKAINELGSDFIQKRYFSSKKQGGDGSSEESDDEDIEVIDLQRRFFAKSSRAQGPIARGATFQKTKNIRILYENLGITPGITGAIILAMALKFQKLPGTAYYVDENYEIDIDELITSGSTQSKVVTFNENTREGTIQIAVKAYHEGQALQYLLDLSAAHQVKKLNASNVNSYFLSMKIDNAIGDVILRFLDKIYNYIPNIMGDDDFREYTTKSDWVKYHTASASSGGLCALYLPEIMKALPNHVSKHTQNAVNAAAAAPYDKTVQDAIPYRLLAVVKVYLRVIEKEIPNWKQGQKAYDKTPASILKRYQKAFESYMKASDKDMGILEADNLSTVLGKISAAFGSNGL